MTAERTVWTSCVTASGLADMCRFGSDAMSYTDLDGFGPILPPKNNTKTKKCRCEWAYRPLGKLHGINMGNGWVRITTDPKCRVHALYPKGVTR